MIPKIVHYCWFGGRPKPDDVVKFLDGWRRVLIGYEFVEWNEGNFDVDCCDYVREAYAHGKYAFVSDYARLQALYLHGGIYLDTDVEVIRPFCDCLDGDVFLGFEQFEYVATSTIISRRGSAFIKAFMDMYEHLRFAGAGGELDQTTNVQRLTSLLESHGLMRNGMTQEVIVAGERVRILKKEIFSPYDYANFINGATHETITVHYFGQSWASPKNKFKRYVKRFLIAIAGGGSIRALRLIMATVRRRLSGA